MKKLLGLSGLAGAGKDATADILARDHLFQKIALADPMKRAAAEWFGFTEQQLWGASEFRNAPDPRVGGCSPRKVLQKMGTELGRACYEDVWVEKMIHTADTLLDPKSGARYFRDTGLEFRQQGWILPVPKGVVCSDVRFRNELAAIKKAGGVVWRITRPGAGLTGAAAAHVSETELTDDMFELKDIVVNDGTLVDLAAQIAFMLRRDGLVECDDQNHPDRGGAFWE
jgi:hypothetical protein